MSMHTVAVMGLGVRGKIHLHGLLENPDYYKVVGLCDIDEPKMKAVAEEYHLDDVPLFTDAEEMLKETRPEIFVFVTYIRREKCTQRRALFLCLIFIALKSCELS